MFRRSRLAHASLLSAVLFAAFTARAQAPAENIAAARALGLQGIQLADLGNCAAAVEKLERAQALYHAPTMLGRLGECQIQLGQVVLGTENLNRVVREQLHPGAPRAFVDAQERARRVLEQALPRIAHLVLQVSPAGLSPTVTISGAPVPNALLGAERPTDPGRHEIVASAPGYLPAKTTVNLAEGSRQEISITLSPDPAHAAKPATEAPPPPSSAVPERSLTPPRPIKARDRTLAYVLLGFGGAGIAVGGVTGLMAISKKSGLDCRDDRCPPSQHEDLDSAKRLANASTIGFGIGLVGAATGTALLLLGGKNEAPARVGNVTARPFVTTRGAGVWGSF